MEFHLKGLEPAVEEFLSGALIVKTKLSAGIGRRFLGITRAFTNSLMREFEPLVTILLAGPRVLCALLQILFVAAPSGRSS